MSLTTRVVLRAVVVMTLALASVCLITYQLVAVSGRNDTDGFLREEAEALGNEFARQATAFGGLDGVLSPPEARQAANTSLTVHPSSVRHVALINVVGIRVTATGGPARLAALSRSRDAPPVEPGRLRSVDTATGTVRVLDLDVIDENGTSLAVVTVFASLDPANDAAASALQRTALAGIIALVVGGVLLGVVVRRTLRPLHRLADAARDITPVDLSTRVPVPDTHDEVAELARDLNAMLERIEDSDTTRQRYLAAVSHEVRTPLAVAEGHLELLETHHDAGPEDIADTATTVRRELHRLRRILDDISDIARDPERIDIRTGPVFVPDLFDAINAHVRALGLQERVTLRPAPPCVLVGDQARIEQSLTNLIGNAIDHNPPDTTVEITARVDLDERAVDIVVTDNGSGIADELLPHVFEPFTTTRPAGRHRSSGLGLAVVDTLTRAQHGRVHVDTSPAGTAVTLTYPSG